MRIESEPRRCSADDLELFERLTAKIEPDQQSLYPWYSSYAAEHRQRLAADLRIITRELEPRARILEYGAVPLLMTAVLASLDFDITALDLAPERFSRTIADLELTVLQCDFETDRVPFRNDHFDAIVFNEIFEHLRLDPIFTLGEALRVLRPGGRLLLSTPNLRSFRGLRNLLTRQQAHAASGGVYQQYEKLSTLGHMGHVREYTALEVSDFLTRIGFEVDAIIFRGGHGRGPVGLAERVFPSWRPFFTVVATKNHPK